MASKNVFVKKMNGKLERYSKSKLRKSIIRSGASREVVEEILEKVEKILYDGIETRKIFRFVSSQLKRKENSVELRYNLKRSVMDLMINGGFVFEKFVGKLFEKKGYKVCLNKVVRGKSISHEIDVTARKGREVLMIESKHHMNPWLGEQIQTALYVYARFLDLKEKYTKPFLVTNTKFSAQVIKYSNSVGIRLMGWNYPKGDSLSENITKHNLYPITILGLSKLDLNRYLEKDILTLEDMKGVRGLPPDLRKKIDLFLLNN
ncbi:hypothetical protein B6U91_01180 [Candidatus Pacearchaeota archaeon ex4484_71]|nr:MAG: hypothetical protein B6U91_01180 [Candidatus Pacearchaeota archaeon ex4484_71]